MGYASGGGICFPFTVDALIEDLIQIAVTPSVQEEEEERPEIAKKLLDEMELVELLAL